MKAVGRFMPKWEKTGKGMKEKRPGMGFTYLIYCKIEKLGKRKYAFEIIEIAKEICGEAD